MRIGIDIDGVLTDILQYMCDYCSKYFFEKNKELNINCNVYDLSEMFHVSEEEACECWERLVEDYAMNIPARPFASKIIQKIKDEGNDIYIISSRCASSQFNLNGKMPQLVELWLKNNKIIYDKLILCSYDKLQICKENSIDIIIDDYAGNIMPISSYIPVICYNANHNYKCNGKNIYRAYSWYDVYAKYKNIKLYNDKRLQINS